MNLTDSQKRALQTLQSDPRWEVFENYVKNYLFENFVQSSAKREDEFNTVWYIAESEGGKMHIQRLFKQLEVECGAIL